MRPRAGTALLAGFLLVTAGCATAGPTAGAPSGGTGSSGAGADSPGAVTRDQPRCTTATQPGPSLPAGVTAMTKADSPGSPAGTPPEGAPFGAAVTVGGQWAFASLGSGLAVLRLSAGRPADLVRWVDLPAYTAGAALTPDGRYLLLATGAGAIVVSVVAAERGSGQQVLGELSAPGVTRAGGDEVAVSAGGRYAFVSLEYTDRIAVFDLAQAIASGFAADSYAGAIPAKFAPVGLAVSPDGRWLYATSEARNPRTEVGTLAVISVPRAETDPAASLVATVAAGCNPVRVITSADGSIVWVTARASDALLAFSADRLRTDPAHALLADVRVGEAPVGLALGQHGSLVVVADSNRFGTSGKSASLAVVDVPDALAGRPALVGYLPAGQFPRDMAASPAGGTVVVANYESGQIETVNLAALP